MMKLILSFSLRFLLMKIFWGIFTDCTHVLWSYLVHFWKLHIGLQLYLQCAKYSMWHLILRKELGQGVFTVWIRMTRLQLLFHLGHQPHTRGGTSLYVLHVTVIYRPVTHLIMVGDIWKKQIQQIMRVHINHRLILPRWSYLTRCKLLELLTLQQKTCQMVPRVKSQFVYPIYNPGHHFSQKKFEESESVEQSQVTTSTPEKGLKKMSCENECKVEES